MANVMSFRCEGAGLQPEATPHSNQEHTGIFEKTQATSRATGTDSALETKHPPHQWTHETDAGGRLAGGQKLCATQQHHTART
jgi:hypothetical protein